MLYSISSFNLYFPRLPIKRPPGNRPEGPLESALHLPLAGKKENKKMTPLVNLNFLIYCHKETSGSRFGIHCLIPPEPIDSDRKAL